jgi:uncharacterized protein
MPHGKAAGVRCVQLDVQNRCQLFGKAERPVVCRSLKPSPGMCGTSREQALQQLNLLEEQTQPP